MKKLIALFLLISQPVFADAVALHKGDTAPFEGILFDPVTEKGLKALDYKLSTCLDREVLYDKKIEIQQQIIDLSGKRADIFQTQTTDLSKEVQVQKSDSFWKNTLFFLSGAIVTGLVAYGAAKAVGR